MFISIVDTAFGYVFASVFVFVFEVELWSWICGRACRSVAVAVIAA